MPDRPNLTVNSCPTVAPSRGSMKKTFAPSADVDFGTCAQETDDISAAARASANAAVIFMTPPVVKPEGYCLLLLARHRGRASGPSVPLEVRYRTFLSLGERRGVLLGRVVRLRFGLSGLRLGFLGRRRQLRPDGARGQRHRGAHDQYPKIHCISPSAGPAARSGRRKRCPP